jgi:hypothetical protein
MTPDAPQIPFQTAARDNQLGGVMPSEPERQKSISQPNLLLCVYLSYCNFAVYIRFLDHTANSLFKPYCAVSKAML